MIHYEVTFIVDPVLSGGEIKATAQTYVEHLKNEGCEIVHLDEMGLRQLAFPIKRRTSGVYFCIEFKTETGEMVAPMELALRRDERIIRFLSVRLDKYGVKYNEDKRAGLIGKKKKQSDQKEDGKKERSSDSKKATASEKPAPKKEAAASEKPAPKKEAAASEKPAPKKEAAASEKPAPKKEAAAETAAVAKKKEDSSEEE